MPFLDMMYGQFYDVLEATSEKQELESHRQIIDAIRRRDTEAAQKTDAGASSGNDGYAEG